MEPVKPFSDSRPLMLQLAKMAGMHPAPIRRMVLVLDIDDAPRLFVESFVGKPDEELAPTKLEVDASDEPLIVDTTSMLNVNWRTSDIVKRGSKDASY